MSSARSTRALRGMVAATLSTFVALLSHIAGGGAMPGPLGIVVPLVFSTLVCVMLAGRRLSLIRLSIAVAISQVLFHTLFVLGAVAGAGGTGAAGGSAGGSASMAGHAMHGGPVMLDAAAAPLAHSGHVAPWMWIAHVVAGLITIAALHRGETILGRLAEVKELVLQRLVPAALAVLADLVAPPGRRARVDGFDAVVLHPLGVYPSTSVLRGPPAHSGI
ncbi:hypothetical protein [Plantibacter sp. YIM 135347]|uniref:hypothetical protein n=1 Tax=Plantibacter sp. YIM 135347 TaxID=3423919 RepID=UPI003D32F79F